MPSYSKPPIAIIVSGVWPGYTRGYEIANLSVLRYMMKKTGECIYIGPAEEKMDASIKSEFSRVKFIGLQLRRKPLAMRFVRSIFSEYPAVTERFWHASKKIGKTVYSNLNTANRKVLFFYEDLPASYLLFNLKAQFPEAMHVVRSHNVMRKGFGELASQPNPIKRWAWRSELKKIDLYEKRIAKTAGRFIAISEDDATWYQKNMGIEPGGIAGFYLADHFFKSFEHKSKRNSVLYLGSADLRKGLSLKHFVNEVWPIVRSKVKDARLILGGRGTEQFHNPDDAIYGKGFIQSNEDFLDEGQIFMNPQTVGAGIKIKSLVAVAAQKLLISTSVGIEGTGLEGGVHCIVEDLPVKQAEAIVFYLNEPEQAQKVAVQGREFVQEAFSEQAFSKQMDACIGDLL